MASTPLRLGSDRHISRSAIQQHKFRASFSEFTMAASSAPTAYAKSVSWYTPGPPKLPDNVKELLSNWSGISPSEAEEHVERIVSIHDGFRL